MHSVNTRHILSIIAVFFLSCTLVQARSESKVPAAPEDSTVRQMVPADTTSFTADTLAQFPVPRQEDFPADSVSLKRQPDTLSYAGKSSLEVPAFTAAKDSVIEVFSNGDRKIFYYGEVSVTYQDMKLTSEYMEYDMNTGIVYARGVYDSLAGVWNGQPVLEQGGKTYRMVDIHYNFNTRKAMINNMLTAETDAIIHGKKIKMMPDNSINMKGGKYTVCDLEHPHYYLALSAAKTVTKPTQKTVFGPAYIVVEDVPLPVALPYGFIPKRPQRATGLLMPTFGEEQTRGFYVRDAGAYFVLGNYLDFAVTGDYYTLGSWAIDFNSRYKVNYKFNGNISVNYSKDVTGEKGSADYDESSNFGVKWSHSQDSKAHPGSTFSASVNFSSPSNSKYNSRSISEALNNQISSSVSYSHNWNGKINLSVNALHSQNSRDSSYSFTLPNISFSISTFYPFKIKNRVGKERIYEKISFGYSTSFQNKINFKASEFNLQDENFLNKFQNGMTHNFSIGLPSFQLFKYININPSISYGQNWFFRSNYYVYDEETDAPKAVDSGQFGAFGITQTFSASASLNTRLYGMFNFRGKSSLKALRHVMSPAISLSWSPDMANEMNGYRTLEYTNKAGEAKTYEYNLYSGQLYSPPGKGQSASASFSIGNNLEAKMLDKADTTGEGTKKVKLIDQLNISTNHNFLADSLKWGNINFSLSTNLFSKVNLSASASFDPYGIGEGNKKVNTAAISLGQGLMRLQNFSTSLSYSISGKGTINGNDGTKSAGGEGGGKSESAENYYQRIFYHPYTNEFIPGGWLYYTNPNAPWSLSFSYNLSISNSYSLADDRSLNVKSNVTQTLSMNGNIKLTPKMNIQFQTGWDFTAMKLSTTQFSATYDLHCFNIAVQWIPLGTYKSYSFRIAANASALADLLKFKKSNSWRDNE